MLGVSFKRSSAFTVLAIMSHNYAIRKLKQKWRQKCPPREVTVKFLHDITKMNKP